MNRKRKSSAALMPPRLPPLAESERELLAQLAAATAGRAGAGARGIETRALRGRARGRGASAILQRLETLRLVERVATTTTPTSTEAPRPVRWRVSAGGRRLLRAAAANDDGEEQRAGATRLLRRNITEERVRLVEAVTTPAEAVAARAAARTGSRLEARVRTPADELLAPSRLILEFLPLAPRVRAPNSPASQPFLSVTLHFTDNQIVLEAESGSGRGAGRRRKLQVLIADVRGARAI